MFGNTQIRRRLDDILLSLSDALDMLTRMEERMTAVEDALTQLKSDVAAERTVGQSAITLLKGLKEALDAAIFNGGNSIDPQVLKDLSAEIASQTSELAASVTANTPAASTGGASAPKSSTP